MRSHSVNLSIKNRVFFFAENWNFKVEAVPEHVGEILVLQEVLYVAHFMVDGHKVLLVHFRALFDPEKKIDSYLLKIFL